MTNSAIKLCDISKFYKLYNDPKDRLREVLRPWGCKNLHQKFFALQNINLNILKGEIVGIVGQNGSGKSTLLKIIAGMIQPSSGTSTVNGSVTALLDVGSDLNPEFSGLQNIQFIGILRGYSRREMGKKISNIMDFADIGDYIYQPVKTYSKGMRSRLGFSISIHMDPEILILDEVLAVGDELFRRKCFAKMETFFNTNCTILYVSHAVSTVNELCTRAIFIDKGQLILDGPAKFVTMHYHKYLFSPDEEKTGVKSELLSLNSNPEEKARFSRGVKTSPYATEPHSEEIPEKKSNILVPLCIAGFESQSRVEYKNSDLDITDIQITTLDNVIVNALVPNEEYILSYKVTFSENASNVFSSILFKTEHGFRLGSDVSPGRNIYLQDVVAGSVFLFQWRFCCRLLSGNYYINIAIRANDNGVFTFLNRIEDALVFKVLDDPSLTCKGITHFNQVAHISRIQ